ncbi:transcriptional regulator [Bordetella genomosp. 8]|uniref:Transcriptional regulator n=1 Tax=Bordetella genomosp. 8 TaxID=1416806 RepID=A0A1W6YUM9_9BORD|nr:helix-turn-helix domain-containing protein [Bordetella genomosp. 8]ARP84786.1 transcriptional regulator [Bordetella genomosp. 8]
MTSALPGSATTSDQPPSAASAGSLSERLLRGDLLAADCPSRDVLKHVTSRWGVLVLITLEQRMHRFSELKRTIGGVSERMLAQTLQWLEADGLVDRKAYQVVPPHVEYRLTPLGLECAEKVRLLADWIEVNLPRIQAANGAANEAVRAASARTTP